MKYLWAIYAGLVLGATHYGYTQYSSFRLQKHKDVAKAQILIEGLFGMPVPAFRNSEIWYFSANAEQINSFCDKDYDVWGCTQLRNSRKNYIVVLREDRFKVCSTMVHELMHVAVNDIGSHILDIEHHDSNFMLAINLVCDIINEDNKQQNRKAKK